jgi:hypothetical protein
MAASSRTSSTEDFRDPSHISHNDEDFCRRLEALLESAYNSCILTFDFVNNVLSKIVLNGKGFKYLLCYKIKYVNTEKQQLVVFRHPNPTASSAVLPASTPGREHMQARLL